MSLNIVVDADVSNATAKIDKFVYHYKQAFQEVQKVSIKASQSVGNGTQKVSESVQSFAKDSRIALTNLSLVVQDLPYGFIGIQNNLPFLAKSFQELSAASGGALGALKVMGSALVGPAGLFLAFSAVTSVITFAVQEYGSLGNAIDAVINNTEVLNKTQRDIAANVASEATEVITLFGLYNTLAGSREQQIDIINKLKDISPEYFGQLDAEKTKIDDLKKSIDSYIDSFVGKIFVENQQKLVNDLLTKYAEKITTVINKQIEVEKQNKKNQKGANDFVKSLEEIAKAREKAPGDIAIGVKPVVVKQTFQEAINNLKKELSKELTGIFDIGKSFKGFINIEEIFGKIPDPKQTKLKDWDAYFWKLDGELKQLTLKANAYIRKQLVGDLDKAGKKLAAFRLDVLAKRGEGPGKLVPNYTGETEKIILANEKLKESFLQTRDFLSATFFNPIEQLFTNFFETGKFAFKAFGDAVLKEIQRIVSRIIASSIIQLLANMLIPGSSAATAVPFDFKKIVENAITGRNLGRPNTPAMNPGAMNFGGSVALTLRGSDLVAAMNRTNTTINRVG